jgi:hypothetical protein
MAERLNDDNEPDKVKEGPLLVAVTASTLAVAFWIMFPSPSPAARWVLGFAVNILLLSFYMEVRNIRRSLFRMEARSKRDETPGPRGP